MNGEALTADKLAEVFSGNPRRVEDFFSKWNFANSNTKRFEMPLIDKNILGEKICDFLRHDNLTGILLETLRLFSRDKDGLEGFLNPALCNKVIGYAGLHETEPKYIHAMMEAQKCLINTLFNSQRMREAFYKNPENAENLRFFLGEFSEPRRRVSQRKWIREMTDMQWAEVWYYYHRIAFIATAMNREFQKKWADEPRLIDDLFPAIEKIIGKEQFEPHDLNRANEAMKTFFNTFCHFHDEVKGISEQNAIRATRALRDVICSNNIDADIVQSAVHAISVPPLPVVLSVWCTDPTQPIPQTDESTQLMREFNNMTLTEALLRSLDNQLIHIVRLLNATPHGEVNMEANTSTDMIGPYFQALARLCVESKHARRYCRMRVLPPLVAEEVKKRPEEHDSLRGRIVRIMMLASATKDVAAEFLFVICKRSVNRMIKYVGFGHSAGHLANLGLLGQINQQKHASDSEDSETEEYNQVRDSVNPVTGAMYPPDHGSALAGMTEEQKEYEAMKLVDAMNKMMDAGIVKPGTIGEDGKIREVSHVLELIKDAPEPKTSEDSDED